ncbi:MAG: DUF3455 domain-containing protein [Candidatus Acidiferrum sp.]
MKVNRSGKSWFGSATQNIVRALLLAFAVLVVSGVASAQDNNNEIASFNLIPNPTTPTAITPPAGNVLFLAGHGVGSQGYVCLPQGTGVSWTVNGARPEATLFATFFGEPAQIITHFLSHDDDPNAPKPVAFGNATWQSSFDSSKVWAVASPQTTIPAGSDPSCPNAGSIGCLLLQSIGTQEGPTGGKILTKTTFIQRLNTRGGSAPSNPATGCLVSGDVGHQILVPYSADYFFFRNDQ